MSKRQVHEKLACPEETKRSNLEEQASSCGNGDHYMDDLDRPLAENVLRCTIEITGKNSNLDCVLMPTCALLNSGGGVLVIKIADYSKCKNPFKQLDEFWQKLETKLESMIQPSSYDGVFDRVIKQGGVFLFIKALDHWCTMEYNLMLPGESKLSVPSFKNTVELLSNKPRVGKDKKSYCKVHLRKLCPLLPETFLYKEKLDFHESKKIQLKHYKSGNGILQNNCHKQRNQIAKQISAFANGSGGIILIGVHDDDSTVLGQNLDSEGNSKEDVDERVKLIVQGMKWSCTPEKNLHWKVEFIPVQDKERCYVIAISVAGMKGGVFTKSPKSYELRPVDGGKETVHLLGFDEWKQRILHGTHKLRTKSKAMKEITKQLNALSISKRVLLTAIGSVGKIRESFFAVEEGCPISPKGFESKLPEAAWLVTRQLQEMSSRGRNRALLVASRSLHSSIKDSGKSLSVNDVICDLLLFSGQLDELHLFTLCDSVTDEELAYSHATAKALKKALATIGGCHEKFYITYHVIPCRARAPIEQIGQLLPDSRYPLEYDLPGDKITKILESLVTILAAVTVPSSPLSNKQGIPFLNLLTKEQFQLVYQEIGYHRELWITGAAGSKKTLVAVEFVKELCRRDPNLGQYEILYVCENNRTRQQISNHGICRCVCRVTFMREDWSEVKHIIMDEVQAYRDEDREPDEDNWLQKAKKIVRQHSIDDPGYLWLFIDNNQINHCHPTAMIPSEREQLPAFHLSGKVIKKNPTTAHGKLINRKDMARNKYSEKGYRDVAVNVSGIDVANVSGSPSDLVVHCEKLSNCHCVFTFPANVSQSTIGDRLSSNACTLIAVKFGAYCFQHKLEISLLWNELPSIWVNSLVNAICDGNKKYDELYCDTAVNLDVEDVVNAVGKEFDVQSADQLFGFTNANEFNDLVHHISGVINSSSADHFGVIIASDKSVGFFIKSNEVCAIIDSHQHVGSNGGGMIIMANHPRKAIVEYSNSLRSQNSNLDLGTLTWVKYNDFE